MLQAVTENAKHDQGCSIICNIFLRSLVVIVDKSHILVLRG